MGDYLQYPEANANFNEMQGAVIERLECKCLLKRLGFSLDEAQAIICDHGYDTANKLSCLKFKDNDILVKTLFTRQST